MKITQLILGLSILCTALTGCAENYECEEFKSDRFSSELVETADSFDELSLFEIFSKFQLSDSALKIKQQLVNTSLGFGSIRVTCSSKQFVFFSIETDDRTSLWTGVDGFYKLKNGQYFSGQFSTKKLTVVIQVDSRVDMTNH